VRRYCFLAGAGAVLAGWSLLVPPAAAACGSANCVLVSRGDTGSLRQGAWRLDLAYRYMDQDRRLFGSDRLAVAGDPDPAVLRPRLDDQRRLLDPGYHHEFATRARFAQADVSYGATKHLTLVASLPLMAARDTDHLYYPGAAAANHSHLGLVPSRQDFRTSGIGDAQLSARYAFSRSLVLSAAVQAPTGRTDFRDEYGLLADPIHQPGTGALGLIVSATTAGRLPWDAAWALTGSYQRNLENDRGYRFGDDLVAQGGASRMVARGLAATLSLKGQHARRNLFWGRPSSSTGGTLVTVAPGLRWRGPAGTSLYTAVQLPVYQYVNEGQLGVHAVMTMGVSLSR
jgi:hypothetical protein